MLDWMEEEYVEIRIIWGKKHDYLGMDLDYSSPGKPKISMMNYPKHVVTNSPKETKGRTTIPAADNLFKERNNEVQELLDKEISEAF